METLIVLIALINALSIASSVLYLVGLSIKKSNQGQHFLDALVRHAIGIISISVTILTIIILFCTIPTIIK